MNPDRQRLSDRVIQLAVIASLFLSCSGVIAARTHANDAPGVARAAREDRELKLSVGQRVTFGKLQIKFALVESDSRCPKDVECVWAGNAAVRLRLSSGKRARTVTLNTGRSSAFSDETTYQGYRLKLVNLAPYPRNARQITASDYKLTLSVSKL
jgi:hypothetical protein